MDRVDFSPLIYRFNQFAVHQRGATSSMIASHIGATETVTLLLNRGANVNSLDNVSYSAYPFHS